MSETDEPTPDQQMAAAPDPGTGGMVAAPGEQEAVARGDKQPHEVEMVAASEVLGDGEDGDEEVEPLEEDD